jgi:DNA-directed RNA polymerase subunit RPC12/RpoP
MDKEFVKLSEKIVNERGKDLLFDNKLTKAFFMDYGRGELKNEINLLVKAVELGYTKKIMNSDDLNITKLILSRELMENYFINDEMANSIILLLIGLLRDKNYLNKLYEKKIDKAFEIDMREKIEIKNISKEDQKIEITIQNHRSNYKPQIGIWTCKKCDQDNSDTVIVCKGCGADRPSESIPLKYQIKNQVPISNNSSIKTSRIICFNCNKEFNVNIDESDFKETICKYCKKRITLKNVRFK